MRKLLLLGLVVGCATPQAFYVANVYQSNGSFFIQKCKLDDSKHGEIPDPGECSVVPIGELPPGTVVAKGTPDGPAAPTPPTPPTPPAPPAPPAPGY